MTKKPEPQVGEVLECATAIPASPPSLTAGDLTFERATLNADIDTIKSNRKKAMDEVATCDAMLANYAGAVSVLDRLIERLNNTGLTQAEGAA